MNYLVTHIKKVAAENDLSPEGQIGYCPIFATFEEAMEYTIAHGLVGIPIIPIP